MNPSKRIPNNTSKLPKPLTNLATIGANVIAPRRESGIRPVAARSERRLPIQRFGEDGVDESFVPNDDKHETFLGTTGRETL